MKMFVNKEIRGLFLAVAAVLAGFLLLAELVVWRQNQAFSLPLLLLSLLAALGVLALCWRYFHRQNRILEEAAARIDAYLAGDKAARIDCDEEGELYRLFHAINTLATVLNAHAENEIQARAFLKDSISDISHQLKTPLAALNIYNGLVQGEAEQLPAIREFADLSEQELDRMETLVQNLLKITRLDAGALVMEKAPENVAEMMREVQLHFAFRAKQEQKELLLTGAEDVVLLCDRDWTMEAVSNLVKNALDHTAAGDRIEIKWDQAANATRIIVADNGTGIHPEDIHYVFKRFYRSRFSRDTQGIGLGLPLAKAIVEAHWGSITVDSVWGQGSSFVLCFLNPTKL